MKLHRLGNFRGLVAPLLGLVTLSGCATGHSGSLANRFVRAGEPSVDLGRPAPVTSTTRQAAPKSASHAPVASLRRDNFGATLENSNKRLAAALLFEAMVPTAASHLQVAEEYRWLDVLDAAYDSVSRALQKEPRLAEAHEALARVWRDWGLPGEALAPAYRAAHYDPGSASAQNTLGTVLEALERPDDARRAFQRALALDPKASWALNNLCYVDFRLGRLEEAQSYCAAALKLNADLVAAQNNMGLVYAAAGDFGEARRAFLAAGDEAAAEFNLGIVYLGQKNYESAAGAFERAIKARPDFTAAKVRAHTMRLRLMTGRD